RHPLVEEVAHRVDENTLGLPPLQRKPEPAWPQPKVEAVLVRMTWHAAKTLCKRECVTMLAPGAHLRATSHGIPRRVGPFDLRVVAHAWGSSDSRNVTRVPGAKVLPRRRVPSAFMSSTRTRWTPGSSPLSMSLSASRACFSK